MGSERGMSLTELVVVVAILGILAAVAVPVYLDIQDDARDQAVKTTLNNAVTIYLSEEQLPSGDPSAAIFVLNNASSDGIAVRLVSERDLDAVGGAVDGCIAAGFGGATEGSSNLHSINISTGEFSQHASCGVAAMPPLP